MDLRGGEVTNEALEHEVLPIMNEFKVGAPRDPAIRVMLSHAGSRYMCRVFCKATRQRSRSLLSRAKGRPPPDRPFVRFSRPRKVYSARLIWVYADVRNASGTQKRVYCRTATNIQAMRPEQGRYLGQRGAERVPGRCGYHGVTVYTDTSAEKML